MVENINYDIKKEYFNHLVDLVCDKKHPKIDYIPLLELLHNMKFSVFVEKDENRVQDAKYLRVKWTDSEGILEYLYEFEDEKASVLEVLVSISDRLSFQIGDNTTNSHTLSDCFWEILRNLDIEKYYSSNYKPLNVKEKVRNWMSRKIKKDGSGGIFPLKKPKEDQKSLQIWDQMNDYILENYV